MGGRTTGASVRLDDDVTALVDKRRGGDSRAQLVNDTLRAALQVRRVKTARSAPTRVDTTPPVGTGARRRTTKAEAVAITDGCTHPVGRRIGSHCAVCGASVR